MFEVYVKVGSRFRRISCIFDYEFHWIYKVEKVGEVLIFQR